jgi:hypothetical protein
MASHFDQWANAALDVKLALVAATAGLLVWHIRRPGLRGPRGSDLRRLAMGGLGIVLAH